MMTLAEYAKSIGDPHVAAALLDLESEQAKVGAVRKIIEAAFTKLGLPRELYGAFELGFLSGVSLSMCDGECQ